MSNGEKASDTTDEMRPLPDGGLQSTMPEWLRRPPAWRDLPRAETAGEVATVPEPDTSVIDPRTLVDVADLPPWLQGIGKRGTDPGESPGTVRVVGTREEEIMRPQRHEDPEITQPDGRSVPFEPVDKKKWEIPDEKKETYGGPQKTGLSSQMIAGGVIALVIILLIIILLVVL